MHLNLGPDSNYPIWIFVGIAVWVPASKILSLIFNSVLHNNAGRRLAPTVASYIGLILGLAIGMTAQLVPPPSVDSLQGVTIVLAVFPILAIGPALLGFGGFERILVLGGAILAGISTATVGTRSTPNQGLRLSLKSSIVALIFGGGFGLMASLLNTGESGNYLTSVSVFAPMFGIFTALWFGGLDVIKHFTLRFILWRTGQMPWNCSRFLDYAAEHIFLRKVGGGYIFIHRMLMEHFATMSEFQDPI